MEPSPVTAWWPHCTKPAIASNMTQRRSKVRRGDSNTEAEELFRLNFQEALEDTQIAD